MFQSVTGNSLGLVSLAGIMRPHLGREVQPFPEGQEGEAAVPVKAAGALTAAAVLLLGGATGGCSSSSGPLPGSPFGGICWKPPPGAVFTPTMYIAQNTTSSPLTVTGASLTGARNITVDGVWADVVRPGATAVGALNGYPPASLRHPVTITVPAGDTVEVMFTVTAGHSPLALGEQVSYTYQGQSYTASGRRFLGIAPDGHCNLLDG